MPPRRHADDRHPRLHDDADDQNEDDHTDTDALGELLAQSETADDFLVVSCFSALVGAYGLCQFGSSTGAT